MDLRANKRQIRNAINKLYNVKCAKVNTVISPLGFKKAFVRMSGETEAMDVANKIGIFYGSLLQFSFDPSCVFKKQSIRHIY